MKREKFVIVVCMLLLVAVSIAGNQKKEQSTKEKKKMDVVTEVKKKIIPKEGQETSYGIPLSLQNTEEFKLYYESINLTLEQKKKQDDALSTIPAPCCPDKPMSTCCCACNLAKSVWGLSSYLITEKEYNSKQVKVAALQWLHLIRERYYIEEELKNRGVELSSVDLEPEKVSCYTRRCNLGFEDGGCGGMR